MSTSLTDRVVAIAGAGGGLGPIVASRLAEAGALTALCDLDPSRLADLGPTAAHIHAADLLDPEAAVAWHDAVRSHFGRVDALLHLVGGWRGGEPIATASLADYAWLHDLLVRSLQHASRAFHDSIAASPHGRLVIVSSSQAQAPEATNAGYAAAKAAAETWTMALADSFARAGNGATANIIVVNAIGSDDSADPNLTPVSEIAAAIGWICSDAAASMNGQRLSLHR